MSSPLSIYTRQKRGKKGQSLSCLVHLQLLRAELRIGGALHTLLPRMGGKGEKSVSLPALLLRKIHRIEKSDLLRTSLNTTLSWGGKKKERGFRSSRVLNTLSAGGKRGKGSKTQTVESGLPRSLEKKRIEMSVIRIQPPLSGKKKKNQKVILFMNVGPGVILLAMGEGEEKRES